MLSLIKNPIEGLKRISCKASLLKTGCSSRSRKMIIPEVAVFVPTLYIPSQTDFNTHLIPQHLIHLLLALRSRITDIAVQDIVIEGGPAHGDLKAAVEDYLTVLLGFTNYGFQESVEFRWRSLDVVTQGASIQSSRFELLCVIYMLAALTLSEANQLLIPMDKSRGLDSQSTAVHLLLKAAGYLDFCVNNILAALPSYIKEKLPADLHEGILEALKIQAIGQATELQLGLAAESQTATLSVKRRLACEVLSFYSQAHFSLIGCNLNKDNLKKLMLFIRWKYLEAKASAYYYHGLMVDEDFDPLSAVTALSCFLASKENLLHSKKICLSFSLASPVTRPPPPWGIMKHLHKEILNIAAKKTQAYGYSLAQQKGLPSLPELPQFHLSLTPEDYELPMIHPSWNNQNMDSQEQNHKLLAF